jgi:hypothetical protein
VGTIGRACVLPLLAALALLSAAGSAAGAERPAGRAGAGSAGSANQGEGRGQGLGGRLPASWGRSADAAWLRRAAELAGLEVGGGTGSAWVAEGRTSFFLWTSGTPREIRRMPVYGRIGGAIVYGGAARLAWRAQGVGVWLEPGPGAGEPLPGAGELAELVVATLRLPRRARPVELMAMPAGPLARCRRVTRSRQACPTRIPRIPGWNAYGNGRAGVFGLERGGEAPGKPELNRPPGLLHVEIWAGRTGQLRVSIAGGWPSGGAVRPRDGLLRLERAEAILLGAVRWNGRSGTLALVPGYPVGGSLGNHLAFRWRDSGGEYLVSLHAWEPFSEAVSALRAIVESLPR